MAGKKNFNSPDKNSEKPETPRKKSATQAPVSLSDKQYEEIFTAVLHPSQDGVEIKSPTIGTPADVPNLNKAASPKESASVENSQHTQNTQPEPETITKEEQPSTTTTAKIPESSSISTLSTLHSDDISKGAVFSTPKPKIMKSFREALKSLKQKMSESFSESGSINESFNNASLVDILNDGELSQVPAQCTRRERLLWLQERRGTGLYVRCDHQVCRKWRWLDDPDPVNVPSKWYCEMNPDKSYASCSVPEKPIPLYIEDDMIHNCYTAGSIVWAKMPGYPWWPAMVDDCPDTEQYYWVNNELDDIPDWYHVVFFDDNEVTRRWMLLKDLMSYKHNPNLEKKIGLKPNFSRRMNVAKQKANDALTLHIKDRLKKYSFISIWKRDIPDYPDSDVSDSGIDDDDPNYEQIIKKKILARRRAFIQNQKISTSPKHNSFKTNDSDSEKSGIIYKYDVSATKNKKDSKKYTYYKKKENVDKTAEVFDVSKKPCKMRADTAVSEKSRKRNKKNKIVKPAKLFIKKPAYFEKSAKETNTVNEDIKMSAKPAKITRRMSADSVISEQYIEENRRLGKDIDMNEKPARITRRMSTESNMSMISEKSASKDSKISKPAKITRRMSADSHISEKSAKKTKESKSARITRRMSVNSNASETSSTLIDRICADFDSSGKSSRTGRKSRDSDLFEDEFVPEKKKKGPKKVTKPGKSKRPSVAERRRNSEKSFSVSKPKKATESRKKSSASVPEVKKVDEEIKISKRKPISSPTFFGDFKKRDEEMAKRQKLIEEKLEPTKMESIIKKVKKSFRPPIKTNLNKSSSTISSLSFKDD